MLPRTDSGGLRPTLVARVGSTDPLSGWCSESRGLPGMKGIDSEESRTRSLAVRRFDSGHVHLRASTGAALRAFLWHARKA
jgi:hypothetical protein